MKKQPLKEHDFNRLAADYVQRLDEIQQMQETMAPVRERLLKLLRASGTVAGKGGKSLRILTADFDALASFGESVSVDAAAAARLHGELAKAGLGNKFWQMFGSAVVYRRCPRAAEIAAGLPSRLRALFYKAQRITALPPRLKVKRLKKARARKAA